MKHIWKGKIGLVLSLPYMLQYLSLEMVVRCPKGLCYDLYCEGLNPKCVKVPKDISLEDIDKIFGPIVHKNEYNYEFTKDPLFIKKIKTLWMVIHQNLVCQHQGWYF